ncbi:MAG: SDR family NAD(P)-dependent oxidoreductase [Clostridia bacterium]|nr:SDR family NAD(P)-dependent oxidoreductase [Clostridia bacterium]
MRTETWIQRNTTSLAHKTVAISGATGGIGRELCRHLASLDASLLLLDRNTPKSNALIEELKSEYPRLHASHLRVDMEDFASVKEVTEQLQRTPPDVLILNAGVYHIPRHRCDTGFENVFQINFVSPYYMARALQPVLQERGGRVVAVGSIAHNYSKIDPQDVDFSTRTQSSKVYGNAKRYLMFAMYALYGEGKGYAVTHPGITLTNITAHYPKWIYAMIRHPMKVIFMRPRRACLSILRGVFEDTAPSEWIGPRLCNVWGLPKKQKLNTCKPQEANAIANTAEAIWQQLQNQ